MIEKLGFKLNTEDIEVPISLAGFPSPFKSTLEFNAPAHGVWNIVHTGMLIPDSHQIYICSANCMRGVVLTAAEMNAQDRFSQVLIREKDVLAGSIEQLTIDGVCDCLRKLPRLPRAVLVFTVCVHHFMGADLDWIYKELGRMFPGITFIRCFMDPIMKKSGLTPDQKMRQSLYEPLRSLEVKKGSAAIAGSDFALDEESDLKVFFRENGLELKELPDCSSYDEYLSMGECEFYICVYPAALAGAMVLAKRLDRPLLYLPLTFSISQIEENERQLCRLLAKEPQLKFSLYPEELKARALSALKEAREMASDTEICIDYTFHPRPLSLAVLLLKYGFNVKRIYLDGISGEEEEDFYYLKEHFPDVLLCSTINPKCRVTHSRNAEHVLALGQKAAWFSASGHFVNLVEGGGWYGYDGILKLALAIKDALENEKDPQEYIPLKGLGCESCVL